MDYLASIPATMCTSFAALAAGTTTTFSTTGATLYSIRGKAFTTSAASNAATPTTDANTGAAFVPVGPSRGCVFVFCYDGTSATAATAIKVVQGPIEALEAGVASGANALFLNAPQFPAIPSRLCPFGYVVTRVGASGSAWTFGASNLAGPPANTLHTFVSVMTLPDRPQVS
jgi:hypothetical protein